MTTIIRAAAAHDLLALVPALAGFVPERSIVCVAFRGSRSAGVLRHDLPRRARDRPSLVSAIVGTLCRMPGVDAVVPIAYTDRTFESSRGLPERVLLALLVRRFEQAGFQVRDALCRAADGWGSLLDPATPARGHALAMIDESAAATALPEGEPGTRRRPRAHDCPSATRDWRRRSPASSRRSRSSTTSRRSWTGSVTTPIRSPSSRHSSRRCPTARNRAA